VLCTIPFLDGCLDERRADRYRCAKELRAYNSFQRKPYYIRFQKNKIGCRTRWGQPTSVAVVSLLLVIIYYYYYIVSRSRSCVVVIILLLRNHMFAGPGTYVSVNLTRRIKTVMSVALEWANFRKDRLGYIYIRKPGIKSGRCGGRCEEMRTIK